MGDGSEQAEAGIEVPAWRWREIQEELKSLRAALRAGPPGNEEGWLRIVADVKVCPKCWAPLAIISDRDSACSYDYDGRADHVCRGTATP